MKTLQDYARWNLNKVLSKTPNRTLTQDKIHQIERELASGKYSSILHVADIVGVDKITVRKYMNRYGMTFNRNKGLH